MACIWRRKAHGMVDVVPQFQKAKLGTCVCKASIRNVINDQYLESASYYNFCQHRDALLREQRVIFICCAICRRARGLL
jgi:hypothetical protein